MLSELTEIKNKFEATRKNYREYLPKVDPALLDDLLRRQIEDLEDAPMYIVEVFLEPGIDTQKVRETIIRETGMVPAIYDNGTHIVTHHRLTLEMLKHISEKEGVIEITGEYNGDSGNWAASHERRMPERLHALPSSAVKQSTDPAEEKPIVIENVEGKKKSNDYKMAAYVAAGIVGAIALAGFIISGGMLPNQNVSQQDISAATATAAGSSGTEPGVLHGYVAGPGGLPAIGATILAVQQGTDFAASAFVSVHGQYSINVPPGGYVVYVAYPDGTNQIANNVEVQRGVAQELNFNYG